MPQYEAAKILKRLKFDEKLGTLVDETGVKYEGRRFSTVSAESNPAGACTSDLAKREALSKLEEAALTRNADVYEPISSHIRDSKQEYDPSPFTAHLVAILYRL